MRKLLLASTALVGAFALTHRADAQQLTTDSPFTVRIDGFANFRGGIAGNSNQTSVMAAASNPVRLAAPNVKSLGDQFNTDTEIHVTATGKADNGLVYGMYVEVEADPALFTATTSAVNVQGQGGLATQTVVSTSAFNYIDEANIFLQGTWGRVEMGDQDGAGDQLFFGAPYDYGPAYGSGSGADGDIMFRWINLAYNGNITSGINGAPLYLWNVKAIDSNDSTKITYLSPVIAGFRAGISFVPDGAHNGQAFGGTVGPGPSSSATIQSLTAATATFNGTPLNPTGAMPATGTPGLGRTLGAYGDYDHWVELGGQWRGTIGDVGLGADVEYTHAQHKTSIFAPTAGSTVVGPQFSATGAAAGGNVGVDQYHFVDINSVAVGGQASYLGFTAGGSFSDHFRSTYLTGPGLQSGVNAYAIAAGLQYAIGPWIVGYNYSYSFNAGSLSPLNSTTNAGNTTGHSGGDAAEYHSLGAKYILAPGLFLFTEFGHARIQLNGVTVNYANVGLIGTGIRF